MILLALAIGQTHFIHYSNWGKLCHSIVRIVNSCERAIIKYKMEKLREREVRRSGDKSTGNKEYEDRDTR